MQLKKFEAPTIQEALRRIKAELGDDAVIFDLHTRPQGVKSQRRSRLQWVEVTAAVERNGGVNAAARATARQPAAGYAMPGPPQGNPPRQSAPARAVDEQADAGWGRGGNPAPRHATSCSPALKNMLLSGFSPEAAGYLLGEAAADLAREGTADALQRTLLQKIAGHIRAAGPITLPAGQQKRIAFVGPTGVGKTTTLAKIAARFVQTSGTRIKIITIDTYRIAAAEQLKVYGKIMHVPVAVAATAEDLDRELRQCGDAQLVLIDTAGRNFRDCTQMAALGSWLARHPDIETHLLLCATTAPEVLGATVQCFSKNRVDRIIITKVDESVRQGHLYQLLAAENLPVAYITNGQRVPEDLLPASPHLLAEIFLNGYPAEGSPGHGALFRHCHGGSFENES